MFCFGHILSDPNQKLYIPCTHLNTNDSLCAYPILRNQKSSFCSAHEGKIIQQKKRKPLEKKEEENQPKKKKKAPEPKPKGKKKGEGEEKKLRLKKWRTLITTPTSPRTFQASAAFQQLATLQIIPTTPTTTTTK